MTTPAYMSAIRKLSGISTAPPLSASDEVNKSLVIFFDGSNNAYYGYVSSFIDANNIILSQGSGLPLVDIVVANIIVINTGVVHNYQYYLDEIASLTNDKAAELTADDYKKILAKAVTDWGKDQPLIVTASITGTGDYKYNLQNILGSFGWKYGYSDIYRIEYPVDLQPLNFLEDEDWDYLDDGSAQDGSNVQLYFLEDNPQTVDKFRPHFSIEPVLPEVGLQNFPDTNKNFSAITTLAASMACDRLATAYAQSTDATIGADVVNYNDKSAKYTKLANEYRKRYKALVFGSENPSQEVKPAMAQKPMNPKTNTDNQSAATGGVISKSFLFHRVKR